MNHIKVPDFLNEYIQDNLPSNGPEQKGFIDGVEGAFKLMQKEMQELEIGFLKLVKLERLKTKEFEDKYVAASSKIVELEENLGYISDDLDLTEQELNNTQPKWRHIKTAPVDTNFIVLSEYGYIAEAFRDPENKYMIVDVRYAIVKKAKYWMPLPKAPND